MDRNQDSAKEILNFLFYDQQFPFTLYKLVFMVIEKKYSVFF